MGEHRKPCFIFLLNNLGNSKKTKVELFDRSLFTDEPLPGRCTRKQYRIRVNGKWFPKNEKQYYASWEIKEIMWRGMPL